MITVEIRGAVELARKLGRMKAELDRGMMVQMQKVSKLVESHARLNKLSGQELKVRSGHLRRNVVGTVRRQGSDVNAVIGVRDIVPYGRIHELGGESGRNLKTILPPRPYLVPSVEEKREEILTILGDGVEIARRQAGVD